MTSSSDVRWTEYNKDKIICNLKNINKNVVLNVSDIGEKVIDGRWVLKGGTATALWSNVAKDVEVESMHEEENGWWNVVMLTGRRKKFALTTVHRMVDSQASGINSSKVQRQRSIGQVESAKKIRNRQSKELSERANKCKATDVIVSGDFNESTRSENANSFVNETGPHDAFAETNGVGVDKREATHQHGRKCIDCALATDGMLNKAKGCELSEYSEIVESDHRQHLTDVDFDECFLEEFV